MEPAINYNNIYMVYNIKHVHVHVILTAFVIRPFMVPDRAAAIPNLPLLRMCIATLKPSPTPVKMNKEKKKNSCHHVLSVMDLKDIN